MAEADPIAGEGPTPSSQADANPHGGFASPLKPRFSVVVGVTGHRIDRLPPPMFPSVRARVDMALAMLVDIAGDLAKEGARWFADEETDLRLVSALAEGADRLCADAALEMGFALDAPLPFLRDEYAMDFPLAESRADYERLLGRAAAVLELPGERHAAPSAYAMAGSAILASSDILLAVWNGEGGGGRGGTGDVVAGALTNGKPVIHVPIDPGLPVRLLWSGTGPAAGSWQASMEPPADAFDRPQLEAAMRAIYLPPDEPGEHAALDAFFDEREQALVRRIEYPLLLAVTGTDRLKRSAWRKPPYLASTRAEWGVFDSAISGRIEQAKFARLEMAYSWADNLANRFAQSFRSGHVVNFSFSALAVALALFGFLFGGTVKIVFVAIELLLIAAIVANTRVGHAEAWQQRWLDYRQLAERMRPMRTLKLMAIARPPSVSASSRTGNLRWIDWYAAAFWRQLAMPHGRIDTAEQTQLIGLLREQEIGPEIGYHKRNAKRMQHLNHRLHQFGSTCFILTVVLCIGFLLTTAMLDRETADATALLFTVATATLPAFGTAAYGLRVQGDFAGSAARSAETADALAALDMELCSAPSLARAAAIANAAAAVLLVDLAEWRLTYQQRALEIPG